MVDGGLTLGATGVEQMAAFMPTVQALGVDEATLASVMQNQT